MPKDPVAGTKQVLTELSIELAEQVKEFAKGRGETFKEVVTQALRRHLANPPPPPVPIPPPPLPPLPPVTAAAAKKPASKRRKR